MKVEWARDRFERLPWPAWDFMLNLDRKELDRLERRELQLTILSVVFVLILAGGLASFMYPLVFLHPEGNKWTLRVAFFGFCALTLLFVGYLLDHQRTVKKLKQQILAELERNIALQHQASVDLLQSMPDLNHFWDRLTMEFRRAMTMKKTLSLILVKAQPGLSASKGSDPAAVGSDTAKALSHKLRPADSLHRLSPTLFGMVLPETDSMTAKKLAVRLQEELQAVRAAHGAFLDLSVHNYPNDVRSAHELEDIVKSLLPEQQDWSAPVPAVAE
jgi:GGDEF domain-containing protein